MSNQTFSNVDKSDSNTHKQTDFNLPKHRGFKIAFLNIASLPKHIDELRLNMQHQYLDILVINETRLDETIIVILKYQLIQEALIKLANFTILCKNETKDITTNKAS